MARTLRFTLYLVYLAVAVSANSFLNAPGLRRDDSTPAFDVNNGLETQLQASDEPATELYYTTENGAVHQNPYGYQRVGQNGMHH